MRVDLLSRAAGLDTFEVQDAQADAARTLLAGEAERFFRAGGVLTLRDWAELSLESRAAFVAARERVAGGAHLPAAAEPEPTNRLRTAVEALAAEVAS